MSLLKGKGNFLENNDIVISVASAVRELIENSINAGCRKIIIELDKKTGGGELIRVSDNGCGIALGSRAGLCLLRKELPLNDKVEIRKSALHWICRNATRRGALEIYTKTKDEKIGSRWTLDSFCKIKDDKVFKEVIPEGTIISVKGLFKGTRNLHLILSRRAKSNIKDVEKLVINFSLMFRNITFNLILVSLDQNFVVTKRQRLRYLDGKGSALQLLSSITKVKLQDWYRLEKCINGDEGTICLLLQRQIDDSCVQNRIREQYLSVNNCVVFLDHGFGEQIRNVVKDSHICRGIPEPRHWYLEIHFRELQITSHKNIYLNEHSRLILESFVAKFKNLLSESIDELYFYNSGSGSSTMTSTRASSKKGDGIKCENVWDAVEISPNQNQVTLTSDDTDWTNDMRPLYHYQLNFQCQSERSSPPFAIFDLEHKCCSNEEDLFLSRNSQLSNPFIISRIRPRNPEFTLQSKTNSISNDDIAEEPNIVFTDPVNDLKDCTKSGSDSKEITAPEELSYLAESSFTLVEHDSNQLCCDSLVESERQKISSPSILVPNIQMHVSLKKKSTCLSMNRIYKKELVWIFRKGFPSLLILDGAQEKAEKVYTDVDLKLELQPAGWFIIGL